VLVAIFTEFLRNCFGAIATVAFNHTQIAILIFSDNRKLSLGHDAVPTTRSRASLLFLSLGGAPFSKSWMKKDRHSSPQ
jgi:hypothetical protein